MKYIFAFLPLFWICPVHAQQRHSTSKKGACITTKKQNASKWKGRVDSLNVSWHYNWGSRIKIAEPDEVEFVPMVYGFWGANDGFNKLIAELAGDKESGKRKHLLGFNEPDHKDQANMSVEKALKNWQHLEKTGLRLGSPAAAHAHQEWMQKFMKGAKERNLRIDFVTVHWYGGPNPDAFINYLKKIHRMYGKPIWVTEFAVADWNAKSPTENRHSIGEVHRFMKNVLPRLDELDFVHRYAWFSAGQNNAALGTSSLFKPDGSLTWIGKHYAAHK